MFTLRFLVTAVMILGIVNLILIHYIAIKIIRQMKNDKIEPQIDRKQSQG